MRFLVMVMGGEDYEAGQMGTEEEFAAMTTFNEELVKAGVMLAGEGLHNTSKGAKVSFTEAGTIVTDGPFAEAKEFIAGYWVWKVDSLEDAKSWIKRAPFGPGANIQIRQIADPDDYGEEFPTELRERERAVGEAAKKNVENA